jgi:7,8-dihydropterin-6-yl-methyl-4-(beta-D-ribofuranosyl)aminobenzene 5'-phosphate synthase
MKLTVVYDNEAREPGLWSGWGFSTLIEMENASPILFDTGDDGPKLIHNLRALGIDAGRIGAIVISHGHGDHTGGLPSLLEVNGDAEIYVPSSIFRPLPGRRIRAVTEPVPICDGVFSTGELKGIEQSLALRTKQGVTVVTGCSHPGVSEILQAASRFGRVTGIVGGLHGFSDLEQLRELSLICPCHCTQHKSEILRFCGERGQECGTGLTLEL